MTRRKKGVKRPRFTPDEIKEALRLRDKGLTPTLIAKRLGRSQTGIARVLAKHTAQKIPRPAAAKAKAKAKRPSRSYTPLVPTVSLSTGGQMLATYETSSDTLLRIMALLEASAEASA